MKHLFRYRARSPIAILLLLILSISLGASAQTTSPQHLPVPVPDRLNAPRNAQPQNLRAPLTLTVNSTLDTPDVQDDGSSAADGVCDDGVGNCTLRAAVFEANNADPGSTITIPAGTYALDGFYDLTVGDTALYFAQSMTLIGDANGGTAIEIADSVPVDAMRRLGFAAQFQGYPQAPTLVFQDLSFRGGRANNVDGILPSSDDYGGAFLIQGGDVTFDRVRIENNSAFQGGGGVTVSGASTLVLRDSTLTGNTAVQGAAINAQGAAVTVTGSTITDNASVGTGLAIVTNVAFDDGSATMTIDNSTVSHNSVQDPIAGGDGSAGVQNAAINNAGATATANMNITHSTIAANASVRDVAGAGIRAVAVSSQSFGIGTTALVDLENSIVSGNTGLAAGSECLTVNTAIIIANAGNLLGVNGDAGGCIAGANDIVPEVGLADILSTTLADNTGPTLTHALTPGSPAIDAGSLPDCLAVDQRGVARDDAACDIGAFEVKGYSGQFALPPSLNTFFPLELTLTDPDVAGAGSLTVTLTSNNAVQPESETLTLTESAEPGVFALSFSITEANPTADNSIVEAQVGDTLTFNYTDALDTRGDTDTAITAAGVVEIPADPQPFTLLTPADDLTVRTTSALTAITWTESADAFGYELLALQLSNNARLGEAVISQTVNAEDVCTDGICTLTLDSFDVAALEDGIYSWTITALGSRRLEAINGPRFFSVGYQALELVDPVSAGFEALEGVDLNALTGADGTWIGKRGTNARVKCDTDTKTFSYAGACGLQLVNGVRGGKLIYNVSGDKLIDGDTVTASFWVENSKVTADKNLLKLVVKWEDANGDIIKGLSTNKTNLQVPAYEGDTPGDFGTNWTSVTGSVAVEQPPGGVRIRVMKVKFNTNVPAKILVDEVKVSASSSSPLREMDGPLVPLPAAPAGFRK